MSQALWDISHVWVVSPLSPQRHPAANTTRLLTITLQGVSEQLLHSCEPWDPTPNSMVQIYPFMAVTSMVVFYHIHPMGGHAWLRVLHNTSLSVHDPRTHSDTVSPGLSESSMLGKPHLLSTPTHIPAAPPCDWQCLSINRCSETSKRLLHVFLRSSGLSCWDLNTPSQAVLVILTSFSVTLTETL